MRDEAASLINASLGCLLIPGVVGIGNKLTVPVVWDLERS